MSGRDSVKFGFNVQQLGKQDVSFSTAAEVRSYIEVNKQSSMNYTNTDVSKFQGSGAVVRADGSDLKPPRFYDFLQSNPIFRNSYSVCLYYYHMLMNPLSYDGSFIREMKENYKFNELGFFIVVTFSAISAWTFVWASRQKMRNFKKRFVYQEYQKRKFLQRSLLVKSR